MDTKTVGLESRTKSFSVDSVGQELCSSAVEVAESEAECLSHGTQEWRRHGKSKSDEAEIKLSSSNLAQHRDC